MTNKKRKGFTIVELVIVIAVIAILAGVLIPTFASIIDKANQSSDIQAVRQMNVLLKAESVDKTLSFNDVIEIVSEAGYDTVEKRTPKSKDHGFYWHSGTNTIVLVKDPANETAELIYPQDNQDLTTAFNDKKADWTTGHADFEDLAVEVGNVTESEEIDNAKDLIAALGTGGEIKLGDDIIINEPITISSDVTIDLNGNTLTLVDDEIPVGEEEYSESNVITINNGAILSINNSKETGSIIIEEPDYDYYFFGECSGIWIEQGGVLNLNGVNVEGNRAQNIYSQGGEINLPDTIYTIKNGYGIYNAGTTGTTAITRGLFIAAGGGVCSVKNSSGTMTISNTKFIEAEGGGVSYGYNSGPIEASGGELNLNNVNVTTGDTSDKNVYCVGGNVNITGGLFNGKFDTSGSSYIYISGDTKYNDNENDYFGKYLASDFKANYCYGYGTTGTQVRVIKCTYNDVTTFIIHNGFYAFNGLAGIAGFEGDNGLIIPKGSVVELDNSRVSPATTPETILTQDMAIYGTLKIQGGILFAGEEVVTIEEAKNLGDGTEVVIIGIVKSIDTEWSDQYGNITITLEDATGSFQCYCLATKVEVGDNITVTGVVESYNGTKQIAAGATAEEGDASTMNITVYNDGAFHLHANICMANKGDSQSTQIGNDGFINKYVTIEDGGEVYINGSNETYTPTLTE